MRLDLFLKTSRLVKRRAAAQAMCDASRVLVNSHAAKSAKEIRPGDTLRLLFTARTIDIEVLGVPASSRNSKVPPEELYRVVSEQRLPRDVD